MNRKVLLLFIVIVLTVCSVFPAAVAEKPAMLTPTILEILAEEIIETPAVKKPVMLTPTILEIIAEEIIETPAVKKPVILTPTILEIIAEEIIETPAPPAEPTATTVPTDTPTAEPTATAVPTDTPTTEPTATAVPSDTPTTEPTATAVPTDTPTPEPTATAVPTDTPTAEPTATAVPTDTPTAEPTATAVPTDTPTPEPTATVTLAAKSETGIIDPAEEGIDPDELLRIADSEIFPRAGFKQDYSETQGYVNELIEGDIVHQYYVQQGKAHDILMSMFPASRNVRISNLRLNLKDWPAVDFHAGLTLRRAENLPAGAGGRCWIRCSNISSKASGNESGVILFPGDRAYAFTPGAEEPNYVPIADLLSLNQDNEIRFEFIRLDGVLYAYADGEFLFAYRDGIPGKITFEGGSELFQSGTLINCEFDDFHIVMR